MGLGVLTNQGEDSEHAAAILLVKKPGAEQTSTGGGNWSDPGCGKKAWPSGQCVAGVTWAEASTKEARDSRIKTDQGQAQATWAILSF